MLKLWQVFITRVVLAVLLASTPFSVSMAEDLAGFEFLDPYDVQPWPWVPETEGKPDESPDGPARPLKAELTPFYEEFERDGKVSIYIGYGIGTYYPARGPQIFDMLKVLGTHYKLRLVDWKLSQDGSLISFRNAERGIQYIIKVGYERNEYIQAFADYEVVMYHGHSRYGQGPAFQSYQNYVRMGRNFKTIEVDARNIYFRDEPIQKADKYPVRTVWFGRDRYPYQYRGEKDERSKLPETSYTKIIRGGDVDWANTQFMKGRQIFYFYSCTNRVYWRKSIRELHPNAQEKLVIGTYKNGYGATKPDAMMIISLVNRPTEASKVLGVLNAAKDCDNCFTTY